MQLTLILVRSFDPARAPMLDECMTRLRPACVLALLIATLPAPAADSAPRKCKRADISVRLRLDQFRYDPDEPVRMKMTTKNVSGLRCTMVWSDGNTASLVVRRKSGSRVWDDEACKGYTQAIVEERWRKGHSEEYRRRWRQHTSGDPDTCRYDGRRARRGLYFARGIFHGAEGVRSNRVWFRLRA